MRRGTATITIAVAAITLQDQDTAQFVDQGRGQSRGLCFWRGVTFWSRFQRPNSARARVPVRSQPRSRRAAAWLPWPARLRTLMKTLPMVANRRGACPARIREASSLRVVSRRW